jgi:hypothetical protein
VIVTVLVALAFTGADNAALQARLGISVDVELHDESAACLAEDCASADMVIRVDAQAFRHTVEPALQTADWELIGFSDTVHGEVRIDMYARVKRLSPTGHIICADRLGATHSSRSEDVQLNVQFASCEITQ